MPLNPGKDNAYAILKYNVTKILLSLGSRKGLCHRSAKSWSTVSGTVFFLRTVQIV